MTKVNMLVVDISHHNTVESFDKLYDSGIRGVIHKATQGVGMVDIFYEQRRKSAIDAGLLWGAYHFADGSDPDKQAEHFLEVAAPDNHTLLALDYEPNNSSTMNITGAKTFLNNLDSATQRWNVLYSGNLIKETLKMKDSAGWWKAHPLWLAQYGKAAVLPAQWDSAFLWQFSDGQINVQGTKVDGLTGYVDRNSFDGTEDELKDAWVVHKAPLVAVANTVTTVENPGPVAPQLTFWQRLFG